MRHWRTLVFNLIAIGFLGLIAFGVLAPTPWAWPSLIICLVAAGFAGLLGNMNQLESFKAGTTGIEAKTREVVREARETINELHTLAEEVVAVLVDEIDGSGRWGGGHTAGEKDARKASLRATLQRIGLPDARVDAAFASERKWALTDYAVGALNMLKDRPDELIEFDKAHRDDRTAIDPAALRPLLLRAGAEPWRVALVDDFEHYQRTGKHRRPHIWRDRGRWHEWTHNGTWPDA